MKKILVPCDFSQNSIEAFKFAIAIASIKKAKVFVLHVIEFPIQYLGSFDVQIQTYDPSALYKFDTIAIRNFETIRNRYAKKTAQVAFSIVHGQTTPAIRKYIQEKKIDLVVMGTKGATGLKEYLVGSNTEKIVRFSKAPVVVVRKAPKLSSIKNIIMPTNLDPKLNAQIKKVIELQLFFKAKLHLLFVNTPAWFLPDREIIKELKKFAQKNRLKNYTLNIRSDGNESDGIGHFAEEKEGGLIAIVTHGRKGLAHLLSGSITEDVVNHFNCPIWTFSTK